MSVIVVDFSDIHIMNGNDPILSKDKAIKKALHRVILDNKDIVFLLSGDIAFSGNETQYKLARSFFDSIFSLYPTAEHLIIPGNHDCSFSEDDLDPEGLRNMAIQKIKETGKLKTSLLNVAMAPQKQYSIFWKDMHRYSNKIGIVYSSKLLSIVDYESTDGNGIRFNLFNTAWDSDISEKAGEMQMPVSAASPLEKKRGSFLNLSVLHHPFNWLQPDNKNEFSKLIENESDWLITCHEHHKEAQRITMESGTFAYFQSDVLQDNSDPNNSGFRVFEVESKDVDSKNIAWTDFRWDKSQKIYCGTEQKLFIFDDAGAIPIEQHLLADKLDLNDHFKHFTNDIGSLVYNQSGKKLSLYDVFVYPEVRDDMAPKEKDERIDGDQLVRSILSNNNRFWFLQGTKESGKTTFAKQIIKEALRKGIVPLYYDNSDVKRLFRNMDRVLQQLFDKEYQGESFEHFRQRDNSEKLIILDNWDKVDLSIEAKKDMLSGLLQRYSKVVLIARASPNNGAEYVSLQDQSDVSTGSNIYSIQKFGKQKREELIEKWVINQEDGDIITSEQKVQQVDRLQRQVDEVIGKSYVPQLPFYVLIILENIDKNSDLSRFENQTNGYFYDLLIRSALMKVEVKASDIDTMYMYLSCLAFKMLSENKNYFSYSEWQSFHIEYMRLFDLEISQEKFDTYYRRLLESNIIKQPSPDNFQFSYSYVYYYFCAQYLADNIEEESVRTMIVHMIGNSYIEKNADIIIFLVPRFTIEVQQAID